MTITWLSLVRRESKTGILILPTVLALITTPRVFEHLVTSISKGFSVPKWKSQQVFSLHKSSAKNKCLEERPCLIFVMPSIHRYIQSYIRVTITTHRNTNRSSGYVWCEIQAVKSFQRKAAFSKRPMSWIFVICFLVEMPQDFTGISVAFLKLPY